MSDYLVVTEIPTIAGDPVDATHNSFAFHSPSTNAGLPADLVTVVKRFYNSVPAGDTHPVAMWLGDALSRATNACTAKVYDITGHLHSTDHHGSPVYVESWTLGANWGGAAPRNLPEGVAICLSYHSAYGTDIESESGGTVHPRARDRGRLYLGPIDPAAMAEDATTHRISVAQTTRLTIARAAVILKGDSPGAVTGDAINWCVWSRKKATLATIVGGWVDDRFDYQRRREDQGLVRTPWGVDAP